MTRTCPCCHQPIATDQAPIEALADAPLATVPRTIVNELVRAYPRPVTPDYLIERIYSGSREPEHARSALNVQIAHLRDKLALHGWTIPHNRPGRGNISRYRLQPLEPLP